MGLRNRITQHLNKSVFEASNEIERLTDACKKHNLETQPEADACPCQAKLYWQLDRLDESIHRLTTQKHSLLRWWLWYARSSTRSPCFPDESIKVWQQTRQPIAAWQKYGVAQRNGQARQGDPNGYIYYKHEQQCGSRPAAGPHL